MRRTSLALACSFAACVAVLLSAQGTQPPAGQQQPPAVQLTITGEPGALPRYAVPDFIALSADADTAEAAKTIAQVLWDDLAFEREFDMIPRDTYASIPAARSMSGVPFDRWRELGADGLLIGTVQRQGDALRVEISLFGVKTKQPAFTKEYTASAANPRFFAHTIADELYQTQLALRGVARTKIAFVSDRDGERLKQTIEVRVVKEIYICDYDGANQRRFTVNHNLNLNPAWSPDGRSLAYSSHVRGVPDIFIANIYQGTTVENPLRGGKAEENFLPVFSPDGTKIAFQSNRDGNAEIYVMNRDGSGIRRITNHPLSDATPTWSPSGNQIAFVSDRTGSPQIYVVDADGLNFRPLTVGLESYCDRPTWSPPPFNEIAYAARTGGGLDIKVLDLATRDRRQITFGEGSNESPAYAPNGRHLAFSSTRAGRKQIYVIDRMGKDVRQLTRAGNNQTPAWSR
jgi:TolB protein